MWHILLNELLFASTSAGDLLDSVKSLYFCFTRIILLKKTAILLKKNGKFFTMHQIYPILILKFTPITIIYSKKVARIFLFFVFTQKKWQSFFILNFTQKKWQSFFISRFTQKKWQVFLFYPSYIWKNDIFFRNFPRFFLPGSWDHWKIAQK